MKRRFDCGSSSRRLYQDVSDILVPVSPAPPSQAWKATGVNTPGRKVRRLASFARQRALDHEAVLPVVVDGAAGGR